MFLGFHKIDSMPKSGVSRLLLFVVLLFATAGVSTAKPLFQLNVDVVDAVTGMGLEYATVEVRSAQDGAFVTGGSTDASGRFAFGLAEGKYHVRASFVGYAANGKDVIVSGDDAENVELKLEKQGMTLNEVVVHGLSQAEKVQRLAYNVSLIETTKLKHTSLDLSGVIDKISGVKVRQSGGVGSEANVTLNGFSGRHVKIFIDGVPMEGMSSAFGLSNIPAGLAKRVEVYKGVVPIELGGDALGGAINIVTDDNRSTRVNASYSFGSFNTHKTNAYAEWTSPKGFYISFNAYQNYSDNDYKVDIDSYTDLESHAEVKGHFRVRRFHAMYHNEAGILKVGVVDKSFADRLLIGFTGGYEYKQIQNAATMSYVYGARYTTANTLMPQLTYRKRFDVLKGLTVSFNGNFNFGQSYAADTARANYNWLGERGPDKGSPGELQYMKNRYRDNNGAANLSVVLFPSEGHSVSVSSTFTTFSRSNKDETVVPAVYDEPQTSRKTVTGVSYKFDYNDIWNASVFVKNYINHLEAYIDPDGGADYRHYSDTQANWGGGLATTYFLNRDAQLRFSYEYALRLPTSRELFGSGDDLERGNTSLKPESSNNVNVSATVSPINVDGHRLTVDAAFQFRQINDYIRRTTNVDNGRATSNNEGGVRNIGGDFSVRYSYNDMFYVGGNFSYFDMRSMTRYNSGSQVESLNYKKRIPAIPYMYGNAEAGVTLRNLLMKGSTLGINYMMSYVHDFSYEWDTYNNDDYTVPTQLSHDIYISYNFGRKQEFTVSAECLNIFDERLYDNFKMQKPGRSFSVKIGYNFSK